MKHSDIVVVIPMFNSEETILRAIMSIESQTMLPNQVVVVDDGSTDNSVKVVREFSSHSKLNITVVSQVNSGPSAARNKGVGISNEKLICFLDSDDEWCSNKIEEQLNLYNKLSNEGRNVGLIDCFMLDINGSTEVEQHCCLLQGDHFEDFLAMNVVKGTPCVMLRRDVFEECGGFDEELKFAEDRLLWSKIAYKYELHTVSNVLVKRYFGSEGNITFYPEKNYENKKLFIEKFLNEFSSSLSEEQIINFRLNNLYDFLTVFYSGGKFYWVKKSYLDMLSVSYKALYFNGFYATMKYVISCFKDASNNG